MTKIILTLMMLLVSFNASAGTTENTVNINGKEIPYEEVRDEFYTWLETAKDTEIIYIGRNILACGSKKALKRGYQHVLNGNGVVNTRTLWQIGCESTSNVSLGTVVEQEKNSKIVKVIRSVPFKDAVLVDYFISDTLTTVAQRKKIELK